MGYIICRGRTSINVSQQEVWGHDISILTEVKTMKYCVNSSINCNEVSNDLVVVYAVVQRQILCSTKGSKDSNGLSQHQENREGTSEIKTLTSTLRKSRVIRVFAIRVESTTDKTNIDSNEGDKKQKRWQIVFDVRDRELATEHSSRQMRVLWEGRKKPLLD